MNNSLNVIFMKHYRCESCGTTFHEAKIQTCHECLLLSACEECLLYHFMAVHAVDCAADQ